MRKVISKDGTSIAYSKNGKGPALILVDGAMCYRGSGPMLSLSSFLEQHFTVYAYDRRGRGESGDTQPYTVLREVEDIDALINEAGGQAFVYGISSGAVLILKAAEKLGSKIQKLALYEVPFILEDSARIASESYTKQLNELLSAGRRGDAVELFMTSVGIPSEIVSGMRQAPMWKEFEAIAHTLAYDNAIMGDGDIPKNIMRSITVPTLVMSGEASPDFMNNVAEEIAKIVPGAKRKTLKGQTHDIKPEALAPVLIEFFLK